MHGPWAQGITQVINAEGGRVQNIAEFRLAGGVDGFLNVEGTVQPVEPMTPDGEAVRVDVKFTSFSLKVGALPALRIPLEWASPTVRSCCLPAQCSVPEDGWLQPQGCRLSCNSLIKGHAWASAWHAH